MVVPRFVRQAIEGRPLTVYGDGSQLRCFTNVHDVVVALMALAATPAAIGEVVNVGNPREISIRDLAGSRVRDRRSNSSVELVDYESAYGKGLRGHAARASRT